MKDPMLHRKQAHALDARKTTIGYPRRSGCGIPIADAQRPSAIPNPHPPLELRHQMIGIRQPEHCTSP
jgi:hypothetical protein